jgi:trehalose utilization protein
MNITVWNEHIHEQEGGAATRIYPDGIHTTIASALSGLGSVRTATLAEPDHGLPADVLASTDVLLWWGHDAHDRVSDDVVARVVERVWAGMGFVVLHSGHHSKPFKRLMGTSCDLQWRHNEVETVWTIAPGHPITAGVPASFVIPEQEMYGEFFDVPAPEELVFISSFGGGEVFRSGCCWTRGRGRIFYFSPGHEEHPVYHQPEVQRVLLNSTRWAAPSATL